MNQALAMTQTLALLFVILQSVEYLQLGNRLRDFLFFDRAQTGLARWISFPVFRGINFLRILGALALLGFDTTENLLAPYLWIYMFVSHVLICLRFLGSFNGGSDFMILQVLAALCFQSIFPSQIKAALLYIAVQLSLSYFLAGVAKAKNADWLRGKALGGFILQSLYRKHPDLILLAKKDGLLRLASYSVLSFELLFPAVWGAPQLAYIFLGVGAIFHIANFWIFGLNRFFFAWLSAYPALVYSVNLLA